MSLSTSFLYDSYWPRTASTGLARQDALEQLQLGIVHLLARQFRWQIKQRQAQQLQEMALNQVTQGAHVLIKAYPPFYANSFCGGNGYTGNVAVVPNPIKQWIARPERQDILGRLLG